MSDAAQVYIIIQVIVILAVYPRLGSLKFV